MTLTTRLRVAQIIDEVPEVKTFVFQPLMIRPFSTKLGNLLRCFSMTTDKKFGVRFRFHLLLE
jgi:hypothetical protein